MPPHAYIGFSRYCPCVYIRYNLSVGYSRRTQAVRRVGDLIAPISPASILARPHTLDSSDFSTSYCIYFIDKAATLTTTVWEKSKRKTSRAGGV